MPADGALFLVNDEVEALAGRGVDLEHRSAVRNQAVGAWCDDHSGGTPPSPRPLMGQNSWSLRRRECRETPGSRAGGETDPSFGNSARTVDRRTMRHRVTRYSLVNPLRSSNSCASEALVRWAGEAHGDWRSPSDSHHRDFRAYLARYEANSSGSPDGDQTIGGKRECRRSGW